MTDFLPQDKARLQQKQKLEALGQFAGGIAHDFNNILSIIEGYTSLALKHLDAGTLTPQQLQHILRSTERGAGLTRQLLAFGRQKIGVDETVDLCAALKRIEIFLLPLLGDNIALSLLTPETPLWVEASEDHLSQILINLAINARDAMPSGGRLEISCQPLRTGREEGSDCVRISVTDSGTGIAPEVLPHIFDPFFTTKKFGAGTGLGLSVVYGIVQQLNGKIDVSSTPREGSCFYVDLPRCAPPKELFMPSSALLTPPSLKGRTVLLAEDEPELCNVLGMMLSAMDLKVLKASNGNHAMEMQGKYGGEIDFLLADVIMPEMDGVRLGKLFSVRRPDTNVIYMSGYPLSEAQRLLQVPETASFISKPVQEETVRQVLERALQRRDARLATENPPEEF